MHENVVNASGAPSPALGQPGASAGIVSVPTRLPPPLVVDLDGTLVKTDLLLESVCSLLRQEPLALFALPIWLLKGRAHLKREIAQRVQLDPALLPYRTELLDYLRAEHDKGRSIILATASDERFATQVADHLTLFDMVLAVTASRTLPRNANERASLRNSAKRASTTRATNLATWQCGLRRGKPSWSVRTPG